MKLSAKRGGREAKELTRPSPSLLARRTPPLTDKTALPSPTRCQPRVTQDSASSSGAGTGSRSDGTARRASRSRQRRALPLKQHTTPTTAHRHSSLLSSRLLRVSPYPSTIPTRIPPLLPPLPRLRAPSQLACPPGRHTNRTLAPPAVGPSSISPPLVPQPSSLSFSYLGLTSSYLSRSDLVPFSLLRRPLDFALPAHPLHLRFVCLLPFGPNTASLFC